MPSDLPTANPVLHDPASAPVILEAVGTGPASEQIVTSIYLYDEDAHSVNLDDYPILGDPTRQTYSYERWIRLRLIPPFDAIQSMRFWVDNYAPHAGWSLFWGTAPNYRTPINKASGIAQATVPTVDPGADNANIELPDLTSVDGFLGQAAYSKWIVLQACRTSVASGTLQTSPLNFNFAWTES